jgi:hypothetical protein
LFLGLESLILASRHYRLEALPGQFTDATKSGGPSSTLQLGWQERMTFHNRVIPLEEESKTCLRVSGSGSTVKECVASANTDYLCLQRAAENFEGAWKAHQLELARAQSAHDGEAQPRSSSAVAQ